MPTNIRNRRKHLSLLVLQSFLLVSPFHLYRCSEFVPTRNGIYSASTQRSFASTTEDINIKTLYDVDKDGIDFSNSGLCLDRDQALAGLVSHAAESFYLIEQAIQRFNDIFAHDEVDYTSMAKIDDFLKYDKIKEKLCDIQCLSLFLVKSGYMINLEIRKLQHKFVVIWFMDRKRDFDSIRLKINVREDSSSKPVELSDWKDASVTQLFHRMNCLEISHEALTKSIDNSAQTDDSYEQEIEYIVTQFEKRLTITLGSDLRGRTSADAAFNLSLAGIQNAKHVFDSLVCICIHELERVGQRSSFQPKYILQMIEKFSVTGASLSKLRQLYRVAAAHLEEKKYEDIELIQNLSKGNFGFHSDRPLLWLWRFSRKQRKLAPKAVLSNDDEQNIDWGQFYTCTSKDLIIDLGSGMGVSLLNASTCSRTSKYQTHHETEDIKWELCNYAGAELNQMMVRYANGMRSRLERCETENFIQFFNKSAETFLNDVVISYKGEVSLIMLQFPSPYRLTTDEKRSSGNMQLPTSSHEGFMVTETLLQIIAKALALNGGDGKLLVQTKCEDVAIFMKNLALINGAMELIPCIDSVNNIDQDVYYFNTCKKRPNRVEQWLSSCEHMTERAEGPYWSKSSLIPSFARTETEVACQEDGTFIHRFLLRLRTVN